MHLFRRPRHLRHNGRSMGPRLLDTVAEKRIFHEGEIILPFEFQFANPIAGHARPPDVR